MSRHILLIVNSYVTEKDPRRGALFRLHLEAYKKRGMNVGLVAVLQRDFTLFECLRRGGLILQEQTYGAPLIRDCTFHSFLRNLPRLKDTSRAARLATRSVEQYIRRYGRPDIIHAHCSQWAGVVAREVRKRKGIPYVLTEHMSNFAMGNVKPCHLNLLRDVFRQAETRLPVSESAGELLEDILGDDFRPWTSVPNMLETNLFPKEVSGLRTEPCVFLSISSLLPKKGLDVLLRAFASAFKGKSERLRVGGDGPEDSRLKALAVELGIANQVRFLGHLPRQEVAKEMRQASIYVCASHYETFGIPVIEAHASGKPVICTRCGGPESFVTEKNGILVGPADVEELAAAMRLIAERLGTFDPRDISKTCRAQFSPDAVLDRLETCYESAISGSSERSDQMFC